MQMANPALEDRHWKQIFSIVEQPYTEGQSCCVQELLAFGVMTKLEEIQTVAGTASKEYSMLKTLEKMENVRTVTLLTKIK